MQLAGVGGQANLVGAFVAFDELERQVERRVDNPRHVAGAVARTQAAELDRRLRRQPLIHLADAAFFAQRAHRVVLNRHAEVFQFAHIEVDALLAQNAAQNQRAVEDAEGKTVGLGAAVQIFGGDQRAGAGHIFDQQRRVAGNMLAHVARHDARVDIEAAAGAAADDDADSFASVEIIGA